MLLSRSVLRAHSPGAIEIAFNHEKGDVISELIAAKIGRGVIDIAHEVLGGQRRTAAHCRRKALHAEFFAEPVLRLSDPIRVENKKIAGHEVSRGQFTNLLWKQSDRWTG